MKLEITKEKVLEAAEKCSQAKETLKTLFPECFDNSIDEIDPFTITTFNNGNFIFIGESLAPQGFKNRCFGLSDKYDWELTTNRGYQILIPKIK